jgi:AcrR family transcriptional regulator
MPKLWTETIETHRREVRDAILDAAAALAFEHGLRSVTMSQIAEDTGIGRATLYKYFPDVEAILLAWHERKIAGHLQLLAEARDRADAPIGRLEAVLQSYASILYEMQAGHDPELGAFLHRDEHIPQAKQELRQMIKELVAEAAASGDLRDDTPAEELTTYLLHALAAARSVRSRPAVRRLVAVTLAGVRGSL